MQTPRIYLDHAATTATDPEVVSVMAPYWTEKFGNPSSLYALGLESKLALDKARAEIAKILNCQATEIIFTGGGTESVNLAIKGLAFNYLNSAEKPHLIISSIEHHAVFAAAERLKKIGFKVSVVPVDADGLIIFSELEKAIQADTFLISIMLANNEVGVIQDIQKIGNWLNKLNQQRATDKLNKIYLHTDACQAAGALELDIQKLHVDLLSLNGSKIYGPKGIGLLYLKNGISLVPLIDGGGQEKNLRSGTENVPAIIGLAKALSLAQTNKEKENKRLQDLRDWLIQELLKIPKTILNGHPTKRLPNNINISFLDVEGEALLLYLDELGIQASTGSACTSTTLEPSHVIRALGRPYEAAHGSLRFTLGKHTSQADLKYLLQQLPIVVSKLRQASPVVVDMDELHRAIQEAPKNIVNL